MIKADKARDKSRQLLLLRLPYQPLSYVSYQQRSPLRQEPEAPSMNATSRDLLHSSLAGAGGFYVAGIDQCRRFFVIHG
jgi:hypothetical protein